jgi:hypothetical protein
MASFPVSSPVSVLSALGPATSSASVNKTATNTIHLLLVEIVQRRRDNKCFHCDEFFTNGHKPQLCKQLFSFEVLNIDDDDTPPIDTDDPTISMHALTDIQPSSGALCRYTLWSTVPPCAPCSTRGGRITSWTRTSWRMLGSRFTGAPACAWPPLMATASPVWGAAATSASSTRASHSTSTYMTSFSAPMSLASSGLSHSAPSYGTSVAAPSPLCVMGTVSSR